MKNFNRIIELILVLSFLVTSYSYSQYSHSEKAINSEKIKRVDDVINSSIQKGEIPGAVVIVSKNGEIAYHKSYGYSNIEKKIPMERNSIFRIASMSKAITTVGVMILYERGYFLLNDPISKFIPEFKNPEILVEIDSLGNILETKPSKKEIKIINLLNHTSGIGYPFLPTKLKKVYKEAGIIDAVTDENIILKDEMLKLAECPLLFEPGDQFQYGLNIDLLGYLIEVISGKSLAQFLDDEIFTPLGMKDTQFYIPDEKANRLVQLYSWKKGKGLTVSKGNESNIKINNPNFPIEGAKSYFSGGGGLTSTAYDYCRFTQMLQNNGQLDGHRIIGRKTVELMTTPRLDLDKNGELDYGFGLSFIEDIGKIGELGTAGSYFGAGAFYGFYFVDQKEELTAIILSQMLPSKTDVALRFRTIVYQALE